VKKWWKYLEEVCKIKPVESCHVDGLEITRRYDIPKSWVKIRAPRAARVGEKRKAPSKEFFKKLQESQATPSGIKVFRKEEVVK
jgi:hypothetical protein